MTNQKTLKEKAKTAQRITFENNQSAISSDSEWVLLADAEAELTAKDSKFEAAKQWHLICLEEKEAEIQQLKKDNTNIHFLYETAQAENDKLNEQIEAANTELPNGCDEKWSSIINEKKTSNTNKVNQRKIV